jgi:hypothetical protein
MLAILDPGGKEMLRMDYTRREAVDSIVRKTLDKYKKIIRPSKLETMYKNVDRLSEDEKSLLSEIKYK